MITQYHQFLIDKLKEGHYIYKHNDAIHKIMKCELRHKDTHKLIRTYHINTIRNLIDANIIICKNSAFYYLSDTYIEENNNET